VIPTSIAWQAAAELFKRRGQKRGYLGIAAQPIRVPEKQRGIAGAEEALLIVGVKDGTPAADAGLLVGDVLLSLEGHALASPDDLFDLLIGDRVGQPASVRVLRGGVPADVRVTVGER
jgi:S1-C subfamily serine protease